MPPCALYIGALTAYVKVNSGGPTGELLQGLVKFSKVSACSEKGPSRTLGGEFLLKVAQLTFGPAENFPFVKNALLEANLQTDKVVDGICKLITPTMVGQLASKQKRDFVKECEQAMAEARQLCKAVSLPDELTIKHVGQLDVGCIGFLIGKGKEIEGIEYKSVSAISAALLAEVKATQLPVASAAPGGVDPIADIRADEQTRSDAAPETITQMKNLAFQSAKKGFVIDTHIHEKSTDTDMVFRIASISDSGVCCL